MSAFTLCYPFIRKRAPRQEIEDRSARKGGRETTACAKYMSTNELLCSTQPDAAENECERNKGNEIHELPQEIRLSTVRCWDLKGQNGKWTRVNEMRQKVREYTRK